MPSDPGKDGCSQIVRLRTMTQSCSFLKCCWSRKVILMNVRVYLVRISQQSREQNTREDSLDL